MRDTSKRPTKEQVVAAYRGILGREPESEEAIRMHLRAADVETLLRNILASDEFTTRQRAHPFFYYNTTFDAIEIIRRHALDAVTAHPSYVTNYLGVRVKPSVCPSMLQGRAGQVETLPIPGNWHADIAEFAAVLRSVELAAGTFNMAELGCGWGCWLNNAGTAAKRRGLKVSLTGVEGDEGHLAMAQETLQLNGFSAKEVRLIWGIASATQGIALFPRQSLAGSNWGLEPVFGADEQTRAAALRAGTHDELPMVPLSELLHDQVMTLDLLHVDIQGGEGDLIRDSIDLINKHVKYLCIGTHSRQIEGILFAELLGSGWCLEIERPAILDLNSTPKVVIDGVQGWRNRMLLPDTPGA